MWKIWKKEIIGISAAALAIICMVAAFTLYLDRSGIGKEALYSPHVMVDGVIYWNTGDFTATLPDGYTECTVVKETINSRLRAEQDGQAVFFSEGRKIYRNPEQPGQVYLAQAYNRFHRLTVSELQGAFLRYQGELYIPEHRAPLGTELPGYNADKCHSTGEIITYVQGEHLPTEDLTTHSEIYDGCEIFRNENEPNMLYLKQVRTHNNSKTSTSYEPFVRAEAVGLDYSIYEWN